MDKLYDETYVREVSQEDSIDLFYLHVRLFKETVADARNESIHQVDRWPVYFILEEYTTWEGEPTRHPARRTKKRAYTTGPDSRRIRQCIELLDVFGGGRSSGSN